MNERIQKITGQVLDELVPETWVALGYDKIKEIQYRTAELIVQECIECADIVGRANLASGYPNSTAHHVKQKIKQHFGVEESKGWVCPKCGTDRTKAACPQGHTATLTGDCPMYGVAQ